MALSRRLAVDDVQYEAVTQEAKEMDVAGLLFDEDDEEEEDDPDWDRHLEEEAEAEAEAQSETEEVAVAVGGQDDIEDVWTKEPEQGTIKVKDGSARDTSRFVALRLVYGSASQRDLAAASSCGPGLHSKSNTTCKESGLMN